MAGALNVALGAEVEPYRARYKVQIGETVAYTLQRNVRAGSKAPTVNEATEELDVEKEKKWERWEVKEAKAQALLKSSVSEGVLFDLEDLLSAEEMWKYCVNLHVVSIKENQREVKRKLDSLQLREDATSEEMAAHLETFSKLMMEAKKVGMVMTTHERADQFIETILSQPFRTIVSDFERLPKAERHWSSLSRLYNTESARRRAQPVPRTRDSEAMVAHAQPRPVRVTREAFGTRNGGVRGRGRGKQEDNSGSRGGSTFECYRCGERGHIARNCSSPLSAQSNGRIGRNDSGRGTGRTRGHGRRPGGDQTSNPTKALLSEALFDEQSNVWAGLSSDDTKLPVNRIDLNNIDNS